MPTKENIGRLTLLGFTPDVAGVKNYQAASNLGDALVVDGIDGPKTSAALAESVRRRDERKGDLSEHFSAREFACKCAGRYANCERVKVTRRQLRALEKYRAKLGAPVAIVSGYRCPSHNKAVGGAPASQHMYGTASDIGGAMTPSQVRELGVFSGIGYSVKANKVLHVDTRSTNSTGTPAIWQYA